MATRRTKQQKSQARRSYQYTLSDLGDTPLSVSKKSKKQTLTLQAQDLYSYDVRLITSDLRRTVLVSLVILVLELFIYFYW